MKYERISREGSANQLLLIWKITENYQLQDISRTQLLSFQLPLNQKGKCIASNVCYRNHFLKTCKTLLTSKHSQLKNIEKHNLMIEKGSSENLRLFDSSSIFYPHQTEDDIY